MRAVLLAVIAGLGLAGCTSSTTPTATAAAGGPSGCDGYPRSGTGTVTVCEARHYGPLAATGSASIGTASGAIVAHGSARTTLEVDAYVYATAPTEAAAHELAAQVVIHTEDNDFYATGPAAPNTGCTVTVADNCFSGGSMEDGSAGSWYVSFAAELPTATGLTATSASGAIEVYGVEGAGTVHSASGDLFLSNLGGELVVDTSSGEVVLDLGGAGWRGTGAAVTSASGAVVFLAPGSYSATFGMSSQSGTIYSQFSGYESIGGDHSETLGNGGATLSADTASGDISLLRK